MKDRFVIRRLHCINTLIYCIIPYQTNLIILLAYPLIQSDRKDTGTTRTSSAHNRRVLVPSLCATCLEGGSHIDSFGIAAAFTSTRAHAFYLTLYDTRESIDTPKQAKALEISVTLL